MGNTFGHMFKVTTFGESHGPAIGAVVDNCPARLPLTIDDLQPQLDRRRPGQSVVTTARDEPDRVEILSGVENGLTLGGPIALLLRNRDQRPGDYRLTGDAPRPSHADFTYRQRYGILASSGGGRASARETAARVAAGALAEKFLRHCHGIDIVAWVSAVGDIAAPDLVPAAPDRQAVDATVVRCPDPESARRMEAAINDARAAQDSIGGIITCVCRRVPPGWGDPVFDKLNARLAQAIFSIPAVKGMEIGSGFAAARMRGSDHNDRFVAVAGSLRTATNNSGGIQGGISNGEEIVFRTAFKPTATIARPQSTADYQGREISLTTAGRHDPCVLPRAVPIIEAMAALVLADAALCRQDAANA